MSDTKSIFGGIGGAAIGWFLGGPIGAFKGFLWGVAAGTFYSAVTADAPVPGKPQMNEFEISTATNGIIIADLLGTSKLTGNIFFYGNNRTVEQVEEQETGKGGSSQSVVTGFEYFLTWAMGLCVGPIDALYAVFKDDECVWSGNLERPESGGEETITLEGMGSMTFFFGTDDQAAPADMESLLDDSTLSPAYRHQCYAFFNDCSLGGMNRAPIMKFIIRKTPTHDFDEHEVIETYKYNPVHTIDYILTSMVGLPAAYVDEEITFPEIAERLYYEGLGTCTLFDNQSEALSYLEAVISHFGGIMNWRISAKLGLKLIREEKNTSRMLSVSEENMTGPISFTRRAWLDTMNDIKVQYPQLYTEMEESACVDACDQPAPVIALDFCDPRGRGKYIISGGCPPFKLYWRATAGTDWHYVKTIHSQEFIYDCDGIDCAGVSGQRTIKIIDNLDRNSNELSFQKNAVGAFTWGGDKTMDASGQIDIAVVGGKPPYYFEFEPGQDTGYWFDSSYSIKKLETYDTVVTVYTDQYTCVDTVQVNVEDDCGQEVSGLVHGYKVPLAWLGNESGPDVVPFGGSLEISVEGGAGGFWWATTGLNLWFDADYTIKTLLTVERSVTIYNDGEQCNDGSHYVSCSDVCDNLVSGYIDTEAPTTLAFNDDDTPDTVDYGLPINVWVEGGVGPYSWSVTGLGYSLEYTTTEGLGNTLSVIDGICGVDFAENCVITVEDSCGNSVSFAINHADGYWHSCGGWSVTPCTIVSEVYTHFTSAFKSYRKRTGCAACGQSCKASYNYTGCGLLVNYAGCPCVGSGHHWEWRC